MEGGAASDGPLITLILQHLARIGAIAEPGNRPSASRLAVEVLTDRGRLGALPQLTVMARSAASVIRDRMAPDAFQAVTDLAARFEASGRRMSPGAAIDEVNGALRVLAAFAGLASENMNRLIGWRFLELGRRIERAANTARFVRAFGEEGGPTGALDLMLELGDSQITYRSRYVMTAARSPVLDLLVLDGNNPRSIAFQAERIEEHLGALPATVIDGRPTPLVRMAARLTVRLSATPVEDFRLADLDEITGDLYRLSEGVSERFFRQAPSQDIPEDLG